MIPAILPEVDVLASAPVAIFCADVDGLCAYTNARWNALIGLAPHDNLGDAWLRAIHPDDRVETLARWTAAVSDRCPEFDLRFRVIRPNGAIRVVRVRASAFDDGWICTGEDITELALFEHELRTPLTSIRGALGLLASGAMGELNDDARELVGIAERNSVRLISLIDDMLDFEKPEVVG